MKHTAYVLIEPGMDRPCLQQTPPSAAQRARLTEKGGRAFSFDLDIPGFDLVDGQLKATNVTPA